MSERRRTIDKLGRPTRRGVLTGGGVVALGGATLEGCATPQWETTDPQTGEPTVAFWFRRADDQIELRFTFLNARFASAAQRPYALHKADSSKPLLARIEFPPQHLLERAFFEDAGNTDPPTEPPVQAQLSRPSRLVFEAPVREDGRFPLTERNLLNWTTWRPLLVPEVRPTAAIAPPNDLQTSIELPSRIVLSPGVSDRWAAAGHPVMVEDRSELWHARLVAASADASPTVRAVWSDDFGHGGGEDCYRTPMSPDDRNDLVLISHAEEAKPEPIEPKMLALTSLGGWLELDKSWSLIPEHLGLVAAWKNRTTMGRDQFVQIERDALLFPSGFFVSVLETSERKLQLSPSGRPTAYLRKRITIRYNELRREYGAADFPFTALEPQVIETPPLDLPQDILGVDWIRGAFWPQIGGEDYEFPLTEMDFDQKPGAFTWPQICIVGLAAAQYAVVLPAVKAEYARAINAARRSRRFGGQPVAVSRSETPGRTAVSANVFEFGARGGVRVEMPPRLFEPTTERLNVWLSSAAANKAIPSGDPAWYTLYDQEAAGNHNRVFLLAADGESRLAVDFTPDTSHAGGFAAPQFGIAGVSAINGPFGGTAGAGAGVDPFATGTYDPKAFFPPTARFLGGVSFTDVLVGLVGMAGEDAPAIVSELLDYTDDPQVFSHTFRWNTTKLKSSPKFGPVYPVLLVQTDSPNSMPRPDLPTSLNLVGEVLVPLFNPAGASARFDATMENFCIQLALNGEGVRLKVNSVTFATSSNSKSSFNIDIGDFELIGVFLSIVKQLEDTFSPFSDDSPIDVTPQGVTIHLPSFDLPAIELGAFNIENLSIHTGAFLPFDGDPMQLVFNVSTEDDPFAVTVGVLGGVGHFGMVLDTYGVQHLEASLAFGAFKEFSVGGVLSGRGFILGGLTYASTRSEVPRPGNPPPQTVIDYGAFVHLGGSGTVLGFLTVGVDCHIGLTIHSPPSHMFGYADLTYSYSIGFFSASVTVHVTKDFSGSAQARAKVVDPQTPTMSQAQWQTYRAAFAKAA